MGKDESGTFATLKAHRDLIAERITTHRGRVVTGDPACLCAAHDHPVQQKDRLAVVASIFEYLEQRHSAVGRFPSKIRRPCGWVFAKRELGLPANYLG